MSNADPDEFTKDDDEVGGGFERPGPWDAELFSMRNLFIFLTIPFWMFIYYWNFDAFQSVLGDTMSKVQFGIIFLGGILILYILSALMEKTESGGNGNLIAGFKEAYGPGNRLDSAILTLAVIDIAYTTWYMAMNIEEIRVARAGLAFQHELVMAAAFILVMLYLTWRSFGKTFLAIVSLAFLYGYFGPLAPGPLSHGGLTIDRLLRIAVIGDEGFYGSLNQLVAAWIGLFMLYAGLLKGYGAFDLIMRVAFRAAEYIDSGIAQTAVLSSAVIGSVNGSQTANAGMTGSFTIPLMKKNGVRPETAGAIEAVASTSGQVLPPIMGAAAFIMAVLVEGPAGVNISYVDVIVAGLIPAAVLVVTIFIAVHYVSAPQLEDANIEKHALDPLSRNKAITEGIKFVVPLAILIYKLGIEQVTIGTAAVWTATSMLILGVTIPLVRSVTGFNDETITESLKRTGWETLDGAREGAVVLAPVAVILAAIDGVVGILQSTGVPGAISLALLDLSGGVLLVAAILSMIICILLGLGMPTTASYTIVAFLVAPTLITRFAVPEMAAHFFVFYAAILAGLTPPIATCVAVAAGIAGGNFWKSCWEAVKISAPLFILPFVFVYHPEIVSRQFNSLALTSGAFAMLGAIAVIHGINFHFSYGKFVTAGFRLAYFAAGILAMVHPGRLVQSGALLVAILMYVFQTFTGRPSPIETISGFFNLGGESIPPAEAERE